MYNLLMKRFLKIVVCSIMLFVFPLSLFGQPIQLDEQQQEELERQQEELDKKAISLKGIFRRNVLDIYQMPNECAPTSITNSLVWLADTYDLGDGGILFNKINKDGPRWIITELKKNLGWKEGDEFVGSTISDLLLAKNKFAKDHNLSLVTKVITGPNIWRKIYSELKNGEDVELSVFWNRTDKGDAGAHMVTVTGAYHDKETGTNWVIINDPGSQLAVSEAYELKTLAETGTITEPVEIVGYSPKKTKVMVKSAISESPKVHKLRSGVDPRLELAQVSQILSEEVVSEDLKIGCIFREAPRDAIQRAADIINVLQEEQLPKRKNIWQKLGDFIGKLLGKSTQEEKLSDADKALREAEREAELLERIEAIRKAGEALQESGADRALREAEEMAELLERIEALRAAGKALQDDPTEKALREAEEEADKLESALKAEGALKEAEDEAEQLELKERLKLVGENVYEDPKNPGKFYESKDGNFVPLPEPRTVIFEVPGTAKKESIWDKVKNIVKKLLGKEASPRGKLIDLGENIFMDSETKLFYELKGGVYELRKQPTKSQFQAPGTEKIQKEIKVSQFLLVPFEIYVPPFSQSLLLSINNDVSDLDLSKEKISISLGSLPGIAQQQQELDYLNLLIELLKEKEEGLREELLSPPPTPAPAPGAPSEDGLPTLSLFSDTNLIGSYEILYNCPTKCLIYKKGINVIGEETSREVIEVSSGSGKIALQFEIGATAVKLEIAKLWEGEPFYAHPFQTGSGGGSGGGGGGEDR